jgi:hypothetical protein
MFESISGSTGLRFLLAALVVGLALAGFFAVVAFLRRRNPNMAFLGQSRPRHARLNVVESVSVDGRRRLVLVRRDNVEHLLLIGGAGDVVVEQGIDAPYEAAEPAYDETGYYADEDDTDAETAYEPEPEPVRRPAPQRPAPPADDAIGLRYTAGWEDEDEPEPVLRPARKVDLPPDLADIERLPGEPPVGTIRPVTLSPAARGQAAPPPPPPAPVAPAVSSVSPEEAALARELEAARRRSQPPAPARASLPAPQQGSRIDFDRVLEQEMQEQLEAAKRGAQPGLRPAAPQQPRRDAPPPASQPQQRPLQGGLARIFGENAGKNGGDNNR